MCFPQNLTALTFKYFLKYSQLLYTLPNLTTFRLYFWTISINVPFNIFHRTILLYYTIICGADNSTAAVAMIVNDVKTIKQILEWDNVKVVIEIWRWLNFISQKQIQLHFFLYEDEKVVGREGKGLIFTIPSSGTMWWNFCNICNIPIFLPNDFPYFLFHTNLFLFTFFS